jgi:biotin carboxyl carrier protein
MSRNYRTFVLAVLAIVLVVPGAASARFVEIEGTKCPKVGQKRVAKKSTFVCAKTARGTFWISSGSAVRPPSSGSTGGQSTAQSTTTTTTATTTTVRPTTSISSQAEIPAVIQNFGFNLSAFSSATGFAGDLKIRGVVPPTFGGDNAARDNAAYRMLIDPIALQTVLGKSSPQLSVWLPLGTKVISTITGTVCKVEKIYSGDYSIMVSAPQFPCVNGQTAVAFEHEHVINPVVTVGQRVNAGDVIATVSDYNPHWKAKGMGVVEVGILFTKTNSTSPWHACVSSYLDPTKKASLVQALESAFAAWEAELGDTTIYDERAMPVAGCYTTEELRD